MGTSELASPHLRCLGSGAVNWPDALRASLAGIRGFRRRRLWPADRRLAPQRNTPCGFRSGRTRTGRPRPPSRQRKGAGFITATAPLTGCWLAGAGQRAGGICRSNRPNGWPKRGSPRSAALATATTPRWPRRSTAATRGAASRRWNTRPANGSTGSAPAAARSHREHPARGRGSHRPRCFGNGSQGRVTGINPPPANPVRPNSSPAIVPSDFAEGPSKRHDRGGRMAFVAGRSHRAAHPAFPGCWANRGNRNFRVENRSKSVDYVRFGGADATAVQPSLGSNFATWFLSERIRRVFQPDR